MPTPTDPDGQPESTRFNAARRVERDVAEMLGLVKGVPADGVVTDLEARKLWDWTDAHRDVVSVWPGKVLASRLKRIFADGHVSDEEREDLQELLELLVGGEGGLIAKESTSTELPIDRPPPSIEIPDRVFVLTGRFAFGPRHECEKALKRIGGWVETRVTRRTDFVVIGTFGSRDWIQTTHGRKIQKAVDYREKYGAPHIIAEDHWANAI